MRPSPRRLLAAFVAALALAASATGAAPAQAQYAQDSLAFDLGHVFDLEYAADPQVAPDGSAVAYVRTGMDAMQDRRRRRLWVVGAGGTGHRPLTEPGVTASSPRWSPDGTRLAYVAATDEGAEIYVRWMDTGQTARLTQLDARPGGLAWAPDGAQIAFTLFVKDPEASFAKMPRRPEGADWAPAPDVVDDTYYRRDGGGYTEDGHTHVFVLDADGGTPRQLTTGAFDHDGPLRWTPDGQTLIFSANRHPDYRLDPLNSEVYALDVASASITPLTDRVGPDGSPAVAPDGQRIAYTGFDDREQGYQVTRLYVMNRDGTGARVLTPDFDRDVQNPTWTASGDALVVQYDDEGTTKLARVTLGGDRTELTARVGGTSIGRPYTSGSFSVAAEAEAVAFTHGTSQRPADVAVVAPGGAAQVLTALNDDLFGDGRIQLGAVEGFTYTSSHDGRTIEGWIVTPPGFDPNATYPLLLEIHGGPFAAYGPHFASEVQLYAAAGYVVFYANPRGSTSYGQAFGNAIHHAYPSYDYDDLMSGVDAVIARGYVDPERLYVTGGSGGGVLTAWIVGHTDRFRAAVSAKPVINWASFVLTADAYPYFVKYWFPGSPWEHQEHYWQRSPLAYVGNVTTPTMLLTGTEDYRTPISESEQFYQALKLQEVDAALVRIPGASHGIAARPSQLAAKVAHVLAWFERYGGPTPGGE